MTRTATSTALLVATALLLFGCSGESGDPPGGPDEAVPTGDARVFPGGKPLSHYKAMGSYEWRVAIVDHQDELLAAMQEVAPHLEAKDFSDVLNTCAAIQGGIKGGQLTEQSVVRFSGALGEVVDFGQAAELVLISKEYACP